MDTQTSLSRRERQIMDIIYAAEGATVNDIQSRLPKPPSHTAVRTLLSILETKGHVQRRKRGREYIYSPRVARRRAGRTAMQRVIHTFFDGSLDQALGAYLSGRNGELSEQEYERALELIRRARRPNKE